MSLFISVNTPNKELEKSPIDSAITALAINAAVEKRSGRLPKGPALDITFMLPGKQDNPAFNGMRMGGYTNKNQTLYFENVVPKHLVYSKDAAKYIALSLQDVVDNANDFFKDNNMPFDKDQWHRAIIPLIKTGIMLSKAR